MRYSVAQKPSRAKRCLAFFADFEVCSVKLQLTNNCLMSEPRMFPIPQFNNPDRSCLVASFPKIEAIFRDYCEQKRIPGLSFGIVADGALIHSGGMGVQRTDTRVLVTPDSVFRIASMSKSFTAMAILKLRDDGNLGLDDPVSNYVPEISDLPYPTRDSAPITVFQLLTMGGGFPQDDPWADRQLNTAPETVSAWMRGGISFSNPPNLKYEYSNFGYGILGRIVTNVSGMPYQQYIQQSIFDPLGMTSTTYDLHQVDPQRLSMGYRHEGTDWAEVPPLEDGEFGAMGGLFTTIPDFARYMISLLSAFPPRDEPETGPIRRSSAREMQTPWRQRMIQSSRPTPDAPTYFTSDGYGFGLSCGIDSVIGYSVAHGGGLPGYGSFYRLLPDTGIGIVVFTNLTYAGPATPIFEALTLLRNADALKPRTLPPAPALLAAQTAITQIYNQWDSAALQATTTESFFQDMPLEQRRQEIKDLRDDFGKCTSVTAFEPENALRGRWTMCCKRGSIEAYITLAPTVPPLVQVLEFTAAKPLTGVLRRTAKQIVFMIQSWDDDYARKRFAGTLKRKALRQQFAALHAHYGDVKLGKILEGDGKTQARIRLEGERGAIVVKIALNPKSSRVSEISFTKPSEDAFVP
jgi:CubicO group peptidase (beta-lactamase class C family)